MKFIPTIILLLLINHYLVAQDSVYCRAITDSIFANKGELYFEVKVDKKQEINHLSKIISIDYCSGERMTENKVLAYANKKQFYRFLLLHYPYNILPSPGSLINPQMLSEEEYRKEKKRSINTYSKYPTYPAYETIMNQFQSQYPNLCKVVTIKPLSSGRKIMLMKISDNINVKEDEPQFLYTSSMHGDEITGYPLMLDLIEHLLSNYNKDSQVTKLINSIEIWICPLANPDGTYKGGNTTVNGATRSNAKNIDLNRNYPDPAAGQHPDGEVWQEETTAFMNLADAMNFVMAANFHGGAEVVNYPWDTWSKKHADDNWWIQVSKKYADTAQSKSTNNSYLDDLYSGNIKGITQGYPWYQIQGGRQDYMNYYKNCKELTIELSATKLLAESNLDTHWKYNYRSLLNFMEECLRGIRGMVTDECSGKPIKAKVFISGHDIDNSHVFSSLPVGNYHRPIYAGTYTMEFSATGYQTKTISGITVSAGGTTVVNVQLKSNSPTKPTVTENNGTLYSSAATGNQWYYLGSAISGATNNTYTPNKNGLYTVSSTLCSSTLSDPYNFFLNSVAANYSSNNILITPNPSGGNFVISGNNLPIRGMNLFVFTILGKIVLEKKIETENYLLNLEQLPEGVYITKIIAPNHTTFTHKLIVTK